MHAPARRHLPAPRSILRQTLIAPLLLGATLAGAASDSDGENRHDHSVHSHAPTPAGVMNAHLLPAGSGMLVLRSQRNRYDGLRTGTRDISPTDAAAATFAAVPNSMTMRMDMLEGMYAPDDDTTLMFMVQRMHMTMSMQPGAAAGGGGHGGHGGGGAAHAHAVNAMGDSSVSVTRRVLAHDGLQMLAGIGLLLPTGDSGLKGSDGRFLHYGMQPGGGILAVQPVLTLLGGSATLHGGLQLAASEHLEAKNNAGFRFGDSASASAWATRRLGAGYALGGSLVFQRQSRVAGHYNGPHHHAAPADFQRNYGGESLHGGISLGWQGARLNAGLEYRHPLREDLNGVQAASTGQWQAQLGVMF